MKTDDPAIRRWCLHQHQFFFLDEVMAKHGGSDEINESFNNLRRIMSIDQFQDVYAEAMRRRGEDIPL